MDEIQSLRREVRQMKLVVAVLVAGVAGLALTAATGAGNTTRFGKITAERIDIVDAEGNTRILMTGPQHMPGPGGPNAPAANRNFTSAAFVFYDEDHHEYGGIIPRAQDRQGGLSGVTFDYRNQEAIALFTRQAEDGSGLGGLHINDPPPIEMPMSESMQRSFNRIRIQNPEKNAEVVLSDTDGNGRIQMRVTEQGDAYIEILDAEGAVVFRAPEQPRR